MFRSPSKTWQTTSLKPRIRETRLVGRSDTHCPRLSIRTRCKCIAHKRSFRAGRHGEPVLHPNTLLDHLPALGESQRGELHKRIPYFVLPRAKYAHKGYAVQTRIGFYRYINIYRIG